MADDESEMEIEIDDDVLEEEQVRRWWCATAPDDRK